MRVSDITLFTSESSFNEVDDTPHLLNIIIYMKYKVKMVLI